jgi:hypothetical protein
MMRKLITLDFVIPTVMSIVVAVVLAIGCVYLANIYLDTIEPAARYSTVGRH